MSRVAVIIPTYNRAHLIPEAIESVLNQTYRASEIVVIDDGSEDNTAEVVASYGDRVRYLWQPNTGSPANGRNRGIRETSAEYLVFLDSDDVLLPEKIERQVAFLDAHPQYDLVFGDCHYADERGQEIPGLSVYANTRWTGDASVSELLYGNFIAVEAPLVRRSALERVGDFDPHLHLEDYDLWLRIAATGSIAGTQDIVAKIRRGPARRSGDRLATIRGYFAVIEKFRTQCFDTVQRRDGTFRRRLGGSYLMLGVALHDLGERREALGAIRSALAIDPGNPRIYLRLGLLMLSSRQVLALSRFARQLAQRYSMLALGRI